MLRKVFGRGAKEGLAHDSTTMKNGSQQITKLPITTAIVFAALMSDA